MSKFVTTIPLDLSALTNHLPPGSTVEAIRTEGGSVDVIWSHPQFQTRYLNPMAWPAKALQAMEPPPGTKVLDPPTNTPVPEAPKATPIRKSRRG